MKLTIAIGKSRRAKLWQNTDFTWDEFIQKVSATTRTSETQDEYRKLPRAKQDAIKDTGGFVGGRLKDGKRKSGFVEYRSMLTLDMDHAEKDAWNRIIMLFKSACCCYSTHRHTPDKPRLRLVVPLKRTVSADEYAPICRKVAQMIGMEQFDDTTYEAARLMFWPSTSKDGEFIFQARDGAWLDPDEILSMYSDWRDTSRLPVSSRQKEILKKTLARQADPVSKEGIVGSFCRTYGIQAAIDTFLQDVYRPSAVPGRYDYIPADSTAGVVVYGDRFAYSHHATDPVCGRLCNSFDLVRLCIFGEKDMDAADSAPQCKLPSYLAMQEFAAGLPEVKKQLVTERMAVAGQDFKDGSEWQARLSFNKRGGVINSLQNLILILENDPKLKGIVFNQLSGGIESKGDLPWQHPAKWWRDADDAQLASYIDANYGSFSRSNYELAVAKVSDDRSYHPIREYLNSLPAWDGVERLDALLIEYFNAEDSEYVRVVTRKVFTAAVARVFEPGVKFDWMLVLNGIGGIGKSTFISKLGGEWYSDSLQLSDTRDKSAAEKLQGYWIMEISELAGMRKAEQDELKRFLSSQNDIYRASYGRRTMPHPRQCVFIGTTNEERGYLRDSTGNRRFWPVQVYSGRKKPWHLTQDEIMQIWAEARVRYLEGEELLLPEHLESFAEQLQTDVMEADDRQGIVEDYLEKLLPDDWNSYDLYRRREYLNEYRNPDSIVAKGTRARNTVSVPEIWCEAFGKNKGDLRRIDSYEIFSMLKRVKGWKYEKCIADTILYGRQKVFERYYVRTN